MSTSRSHVIVGLSGGVDSAVAALLLKQQGYQVSGLFMKNWEEDDRDGHCSAEEDLREVRKVCDILDIPLHAVNFSAEYWERVFSYFLAELSVGRTPNPDVLCNREIKFKAFLDHALSLGADHIATGHYARIGQRHNVFSLLKASDRNKDQSYFLHTLGQKELGRTLFPLGELTKPEVRAIAEQAGLPNYARKDSTGICFIGDRNCREFLGHYLPAQPGEMRTLDGATKGRHDGLMYYTMGQRQGLGIGGPGEAWYVVGKDLARNILYVEQGEHHPALYSPGLLADQISWVAGNAPDMPLRCSAKTRYRQPDQGCEVRSMADGTLEVIFGEVQRAVTPGQSVVLYDNDLCLGGGVITATLASAAHSSNALPTQVKSY